MVRYDRLRRISPYTRLRVRPLIAATDTISGEKRWVRRCSEEYPSLIMRGIRLVITVGSFDPLAERFQILAVPVDGFAGHTRPCALKRISLYVVRSGKGRKEAGGV